MDCALAEALPNTHVPAAIRTQKVLLILFTRLPEVTVEQCGCLNNSQENSRWVEKKRKELLIRQADEVFGYLVRARKLPSFPALDDAAGARAGRPAVVSLAKHHLPASSHRVERFARQLCNDLQRGDGAIDV